MVPAMLRGEPTWPELRRFGVGWWVRSNDTLRRLIEKVWKSAFWGHYLVTLWTKERRKIGV